MGRKALIASVAFFVIAGALFMPRRVWALPRAAIPYAADIAAAERNERLPEMLLGRVLYQESRYRDDIISGDTVSSAGAVGIAQIVPRWHPTVDPLNPQDSIYYAAEYLGEMYDKFGSWHRALAAYNWGPGNLQKAIDRYGDKWLLHAPEETQNYVTEILSDVEVSA